MQTLHPLEAFTGGEKKNWFIHWPCKMGMRGKQANIFQTPRFVDSFIETAEVKV